ncbi:MAG: transposase [Gammaproteobacteria bacterium]|nr:transposase [Gammaproteobacteria bacterium]MDH4315060.1 transposase [Gammaproteobacteria bacterium]MDH5214033.1 transposase [Gammaproteobacteria bacterium]
MGRQPRTFIPGYPHHIVQRGHNHNAVFVEKADYETYLKTLIEWKAKYDVGVYAYCLMTNHVHLVLVPYSDGNAISHLMRRLSARHGRRINRLEQRTGTLWSGRFKSSLIDTDRYLMACLRYVELNPVRAGIADRPDEYPWSSYAERIGSVEHYMLDPDPVTADLGSTAELRRQAYVAYVAEGIAPEERQFLRNAVRRNQLTGDSGFVDEIERRTGLRIEARGPGRPVIRSGTITPK